MLDTAEGMLQNQILESNLTAIIFYLKTQGKSRGYVEKTETDHTTGGEKINTFKIEVTNPQTAEKLNKWLNEDN